MSTGLRSIPRTASARKLPGAQGSSGSQNPRQPRGPRRPARGLRPTGLRGPLAAFVVPTLAVAAAGPPPLPAEAPKLAKDVTVVVAGSSVSVCRYNCWDLPQWTGGDDRMPPLANGMNVFFRIFEILNDHENMCWRRLTDKDWTRQGDWKPELNLPYNKTGYGVKVAYIGGSQTNTAELAVPAGYEKLELIYSTDPMGDKIKVTIDGKPPAQNALIDTCQQTAIPAKAELGADIETIDSHGKVHKLGRPTRGISHLELYARYKLDPAQGHTVRIERATDEPGKRILVWGAVYWRGNCVKLVQRAKGGLNCGDLPKYHAIQEVMAVQPDYLLMEAINIRDDPKVVFNSFETAFAWCAMQVKQGRFKMLVYATPQASSHEFRKWFRDPAHKPPYGSANYEKTCSDENADACAALVVDLCKTHGFPLVDVGPAADEFIARTPKAKFVPHVLDDWYHPNQWGAVLFGQVLHDGIRKNWPELPVRPAAKKP